MKNTNPEDIWQQQFRKKFLWNQPISYLEIEEWIKSLLEQEKIKMMEEVRYFLKNSSVWSSDYIYQNKVKMLEQFDKKFHLNN